MYSLRLVDRASRCSLCPSEVPAGGFAGYHYEQLLCRACFAQAEPRVAGVWAALVAGPGESLREIEDPAKRCGNCRREVGSKVVGFNGRVALCRQCFGSKAPHLAAVLILDQGVREWKASQGESAEIALLAEAYARCLEDVR